MTDGQKLCLNGCFQVKPVSHFGTQRRSPDGLSARCKACELERAQRQRHGMSGAEKVALATEQGGCAVCHRPTPGRKGWVVDHDHACCPGQYSCGACRRGILCQWCNNALGQSFDNPQTLRALADYIESGERISQASVERVGRAIRLSDSVDRVARRRDEITDVLTESLTHQPETTSSSVTHARTYENVDLAVDNYQAQVRALRDELKALR